jgi:teichuronic acid biosynthesis glycosyltransferase TuaG
MMLASIIMPYFKKKKYFKSSYYSALNQNIKNKEIIIVYDDEDKSEINYLNKIINKRKNTILIVNKKNYGVGISRNIGINSSKGKYICFLDCDDIWKKNKLKWQINYMKENNLVFTHTAYSIINETGKLLHSIKAKKELKYSDLIKSCDLALSTVIIKRDIFKFFSFKSIKTKEDYLLWLEMSKSNIKIMGINKILSLWRRVPDSLSSNIMQKIKDAFTIYYQYEKCSIFTSVINIFILSFFAFKKKIKTFNL